MGGCGFDLVLRARRAVIGDSERPAVVAVRDGRVAAIADPETPDAALGAGRVVELGPEVVLLPGLVDTHVHLQDPGRTDWEDFGSATLAAAAGGVTTLIDMPVDSVPPTMTRSALEAKRAAARGRVHVDVGFWAGISPVNLGHLDDLHEAGVFGFKSFLPGVGIPEFPPVTAGELVDMMRRLAAFDGLLLVHAERPRGMPATHVYRDYLDGLGPETEDRAVAMVADAARRTGCRTHIVHVSSAGALPRLERIREAGARITAETCPHYLALSAEDVPDADTAFKVCPPIRERANADRLWAGLEDGLLDLVVTDHSPCGPRDTGDFGSAPGGIASLRLGLSLVWTHARCRGLTLADVARWMCAGPADLAGLTDRGRIAVGNRADLCVVAPDETFVADSPPYAGRTLSGVVRQTWLRGHEITGERPNGRLLSRTS